MVGIAHCGGDLYDIVSLREVGDVEGCIREGDYRATGYVEELNGEGLFDEALDSDLAGSGVG